MKYVVIGILSLLCALAPAQLAFAHVLITDDSGTYGAILHIDPGDNPVAGQPATLILDTQQLAGTTTVVIGDVTGHTTTLTARTTGSMAEVHYTFPSQGVYSLVFTVHSSHHSYIFHQSQLISQGTVAQPLTQPHHQWARALLVASLAGLGLLTAILLGRWRMVGHQSTY